MLEDRLAPSLSGQLQVDKPFRRGVAQIAIRPGAAAIPGFARRESHLNFVGDGQARACISQWFRNGVPSGARCAISGESDNRQFLRCPQSVQVSPAHWHLEAIVELDEMAVPLDKLLRNGGSPHPEGSMDL